MASARFRSWTLPQLALVFVAIGLVLLPRDALAVWIGGRDDAILSAVRFIGAMTMAGGVSLLAPVLLRRARPTARAWGFNVAAFALLATSLFMMGRGQLYAGCVFATLSFIAVGMTACFAIWRPEEIKLRAVLPRALQQRLFGVS